jgi:hypothetical protein
MRLPTTNEGWSALATVVSAVAALLNIVLIGFLARYTIRQTQLFEKQTAISAAQADLVVKADAQRTMREMHEATVSMLRASKKCGALMTALQHDSLKELGFSSICPEDWSASAAALIAAFPQIIPLPAQFAVDALAAEEAIKQCLASSSEADRRSSNEQAWAAVSEVTHTISKMIAFLEIKSEDAS